ncbi:MAG: hypothetical protein J1E83_01490 [Lachnospiraceae bacterium]|nr:hypothetical protein [Lachnospiraceae bacterium]
MKKKKFLACLMACAMVLSLAACGDTNNDAPAPESDVVETTPEESTGGDETPAAAEDVSIDFEDGNFAFARVYTKPANAAATELAVADFNGSKALEVKFTREGAKIAPYVAIDASSLLGADVAKVASMEVSLGVAYDNGSFNAVSGKIYAWSGEGLVESFDEWSVYLATANPKKAVATLSAGEEFVANANNIFIISLETDNGVADGNGNATLYIDNIRFLDASGNLLTADSSVAFAAPAGFENSGHDVNLLYVDNKTELDGFAASAGAWSQAGIDLTDEQRALLVPGSVIEINYKSDAPVWMVAIGENPLGGWLRAVNQDTFVVDGYVAADSSTVQYTYEQLAAYWGDGFEQYLGTLQCESSADWEVYAVSIGTKSTFATVGSATELDGFAASAGAWSQAGIDLTDEQRALLVPGSVIEINYKSDAPVWMVAIGDNPLGGWLRAVNQDTFEVDGAVSEDSSTVQYTYEQLAAYWGDGFEQYLSTLQCESSADWEVYAVKIGVPVKPAHNVTELDGFAASAGGWAQAGIDLTDEQRALFVPGCVVTINFKSDAPVWMVAIGENPLGGWLRAVNQDTFVVDGAVFNDGGSVQYTYEQLAAYWGDGFEQYLGTLQCESSADWEVYSVAVGMTE